MNLSVNQLAVFFRHRNLPFKVALILIIMFPFVYFSDFYQHFNTHFTGGIMGSVITSEWGLVVLNIILFSAFLIPLSFRRKIDWTEYGMVTAFFISLFVEMYGIPLTIVFASRLFGSSQVDPPAAIYSLSFFGVTISMDIVMVYGTFLMTIGTILVALGWLTLYKNMEKKKLVTRGVYSYSRHPQYFGFILLLLGWLFGWPTPLTVVFVPVLIYKYIRLSQVEEKELSDTPGYRDYRKRTPFFI